MAGRFSNVLPPKLDRRWLLILLLILLVVVVPAVFFGLRNLGGASEAAPVTTEDAAARYQAAIDREPNLIEGYRSLSLVYGRAGRLDDAIAVWQSAVKANQGQVWPLLGLGRAYAESGQPLQARDTFYQAVTLAPQDSAANAALAAQAEQIAGAQAIKGFLAARLPDDDPDQVDRYLTLLRQPLGNGWDFLGYYGDLSILASGQRTSLWTFWQSPMDDTAPLLSRASWQQVAPGIWARQAAAANLVQNGNFEGEISPEGPQGLTEDLFKADPTVRQVRRLARSDGFTTVGVLDNNAQNTQSSFVSPPQPVRQDTLLLVAADVHNEGGNPGVAWTWSSSQPVQNWPLQRSAEPTQVTGDWRTHLALAVPPPNVETAQLQLLNTDSTGAVYFDNAVMTAIGAPASLWPVLAVTVVAQTPAAAAPDATPAPAGATPKAAAPDAAAPAATPAPAGATPTAAAQPASPTPSPTATLSAQQQRAAGFAREMQRYGAYPALLQDPQWLAEMAELGPVERIGQTLASGWTLLGYSTVDETGLARGEPTPLLLYWQGPAAAVPGPAAEGWITLGRGRWLQWLPAVTNSLPNGTFEHGLSGWTGSVFFAPASTRQVAITTRGDYSTTVGVLTNTLAFTYTSMVSPAQPIPPNQVFLQAGWLRTDDAYGWIGYQWLGDIAPADLPPNHYIAEAAGRAAWRHYSSVAEPPPGARQVQVHLLNFPSSGAASFDDIVFAPIPAPISAAALIQQANARALLNQYIADPSIVQDEQWLTAVAAAGPLRRLDQPIDGGWTFAGYSADEQALAAGAIAPIFYFWRGPLNQAPRGGQPGWYNIDAGLWLQIDRTSSLLPSDQQLALPGAPTTVPVAVDAELLYLQAANVRSLDGAAVTLGLDWQGAALNPSAAAQRIAPQVKSSEATAVAGLLRPPPGAVAATLLLTSANSTAEAEADQLLLLPVTPPTPATLIRPFGSPVPFGPLAPTPSASPAFSSTFPPVFTPALPAPSAPSALPGPIAPSAPFAPFAPLAPLALPTPPVLFVPPPLPASLITPTPAPPAPVLPAPVLPAPVLPAPGLPAPGLPTPPAPSVPEDEPAVGARPVTRPVMPS